MATITDQVLGSTRQRKPDKGAAPKPKPDTGSTPDIRTPRSEEEVRTPQVPDMDPPEQGDDRENPTNQANDV